MADLTAVYEALRKADAAGNTADAKQLADYIRAQSKPKSFDSDGKGGLVPTGSPEAAALQSPTSGMGTGERFAAGMGMGMTNVARGAGQMVGAVSRQDVADSRLQDAALSGTSAGKWGNIAGTAAALAPTMLIPGANTLAGSAAIGAGSGLLQPSTSTSETLKNTGLGAAAGPAGLLLGRGAGVVYNAGKSFIEPLLASGQQRIAARAIQGFAGNPEAQAAALANIRGAGPSLPGAMPTTAELAQNGGLSTLERALRNNNPTDFAARDMVNRGAIKNAIGGIAQDASAREAAVSARTAATNPMYEAAKSETAAVDPELQALLARPSMQAAQQRAAKLAAEQGGGVFGAGGPIQPGASGPLSGAKFDPITMTPQQTGSGLGSLGNTPAIPASVGRSVASPGAQMGGTIDPLTLLPVQPTMTGRTAQQLKMALNDIANVGPQMGMGSHEIGAVRNTLGDFNGWTQQNIPGLRAADAKFADLSGPINRMDIGQELSDRLLPALGDYGATPRLNAEAFAKAVRNGDQIASKVTGNKAATLDTILQPHELEAIQGIGRQLAGRANAQDLGRAAGSNTAQNLVSQNALRNVFGPMGLPQGWIESAARSALGQTIMKPVQMAGAIGEPQIMGLLHEAMLNPSTAQKLLSMQTASPAARALWQRQGLLGSTADALANTSQQ